MPKNANVLTMIDNLLAQADLEKQAANEDLASDGKSSHPSANVEDGTQDATEGARSSENEADVKKDVPNNVEESESKNPEGGSTNAADSMGTQSMAADEMKGDVETPKKDHSKSMSDSGPGDDTFDGEWDKASADQLVAGANSLLKQINSDLEKGAAKAKTPKVEVEVEVEDEDEEDEEEKEASDKLATMYKEAAAQYPEDEEAGYAAAGMLIDYLVNTKQASDNQEEEYANIVSGAQKQAADDAKLYMNFLDGFKQAMELPMEAMGGEEAAMPPEAGGEEAALAALAGGGEGGEEMGGEGSDDEAIIEAIAEALDEAGVSPEELAQAIAESQGAGGEELGAEAGAEEGADLGALMGAEAGGEAGAEAPVEPKIAADKAATKDALKAAVRNIVRG